VKLHKNCTIIIKIVIKGYIHISGKYKRTTGPDDIPAVIIKDCAAVLSHPLLILFNICLKSAIIPTTWKSSKVCPVFKKGNKLDISNFRPITIICNFSKIFEIVLNRFLSTHVNSLMSPYQHGFIRGRSTVTNLATITQYIAEGIDRSSQTDVIYMDFSKAFDRLDHGILINKLSTFGLSNTLLKLFNSYLQDRKQYVFYKGHRSIEYVASSGVPQGSILGPLLFNMFINDVISVIDVQCLLYADDLKIFTRISSIRDCELLADNLSRIEKWCDSNRLALNTSKCYSMSFSLKKEPMHYNYKINDIVLHRPETFLDLGVTFDPELSFVPHINTTIASAYRMYGFVVRSSSDFVKESTLKTLYFSFVRSKLEYASVVWSPGYTLHIERLESVQRRFLKLLSFKADGSYPPIGTPNNELLTRHRIDSLLNRRSCSSITFLYKLVHNIFDCSDLLRQLNFHIPRVASRTDCTFYLKTARTNVLQFSPMHVMCANCNALGADLDIFKCSISDIRSSSLNK
jgi:Reverse transcriptase (RNA-dependent DNA polymerase)